MSTSRLSPSDLLKSDASAPEQKKREETSEAFGKFNWDENVSKANKLNWEPVGINYTQDELKEIFDDQGFLTFSSASGGKIPYLKPGLYRTPVRIGPQGVLSKKDEKTVVQSPRDAVGVILSTLGRVAEQIPGLSDIKELGEKIHRGVTGTDDRDFLLIRVNPDNSITTLYNPRRFHDYVPGVMDSPMEEYKAVQEVVFQYYAGLKGHKKLTLSFDTNDISTIDFSHVMATLEVAEKYHTVIDFGDPSSALNKALDEALKNTDNSREAVAQKKLAERILLKRDELVQLQKDNKELAEAEAIHTQNTIVKSLDKAVEELKKNHESLGRAISTEDTEAIKQATQAVQASVKKVTGEYAAVESEVAKDKLGDEIYKRYRKDALGKARVEINKIKKFYDKDPTAVNTFAKYANDKNTNPAAATAINNVLKDFDDMQRQNTTIRETAILSQQKDEDRADKLIEFYTAHKTVLVGGVAGVLGGLAGEYRNAVTALETAATELQTATNELKEFKKDKPTQMSVEDAKTFETMKQALADKQAVFDDALRMVKLKSDTIEIEIKAIEKLNQRAMTDIKKNKDETALETYKNFKDHTDIDTIKTDLEVVLNNTTNTLNDINAQSSTKGKTDGLLRSVDKKVFSEDMEAIQKEAEEAEKNLNQAALGLK